MQDNLPARREDRIYDGTMLNLMPAVKHGVETLGTVCSLFFENALHAFVDVEKQQPVFLLVSRIPGRREGYAFLSFLGEATMCYTLDDTFEEDMLRALRCVYKELRREEKACF